jgi:diguanylate cyclase
MLTALPALPSISYAGNVVVNETQSEYNLGRELEILHDKEGSISIESAIVASQWQPSLQDSISLGLSDDDWWFRFDATSAARKEQLLLIELAYTSLDYINVYFVDNGEIIQHFDMGDHNPFHQRPIDHHNFVLPIEWPAEKTLSVYFHVRTSGVVQLPLTLWKPAAFSASDQLRQMSFGLYFGAMLIMIVYNLFMYFALRDRSYIHCVGFVACITLFVASLTGYSYQYLWPNSPKWNGQSIGFFLSAAVLCATLFTYRFLKADNRERTPFIRYGIAGTYILSILMILSSLILPYTQMLILVIGGAVFACIGALVIGIHGWLAKESAAKHYLLAWSSLFVSGLILAANKFSYISKNGFTDNAVQVGSSMLVALLSFAIAHRLNEEKRHRFEAQLETLNHERAARAAKEEALNVQRQANRELEIKVHDRTEELRAANSILQEMSSTDVLTGLKNRRFFDEQSNQEYVRCFRYQHPISLIFIDIDHFKKFNDTYGHLIGDEALRTVAALLAKAQMRDSDIVARYGGEEFCILLPETNLDGALAAAERICASIADEPFMVNGKRIPLTASLGVTSHIPTSPEYVTQLVQTADQALYNAKDNGRNRVESLLDEPDTRKRSRVND